MENIGRFWLIWNPEGQNPKTRHDNPTSAMTEAKRLAGLTGKDIYVLEAIAVARQAHPPVEYIALSPPMASPTKNESPE